MFRDGALMRVAAVGEWGEGTEDGNDPVMGICPARPILVTALNVTSFMEQL